MADKAYLAKAVPGSEEFGVIPNENQTPYVNVKIQLFDDNEVPTDEVTWRGWCSPKALQGTYERLRMLGARVADDDIADLVGLGSKKVNVTLETDRFGTRVQYINPLGGRVASSDTKMTGAALDAFRAKMKSQIAAARIATGNAIQAPAPSATPFAPSGGTKKPFNWTPPAAAPAPEPEPWDLEGKAVASPPRRLPAEIEEQIAATNALVAGVSDEEDEGDPARGDAAEDAPVAADGVGGERKFF